MVVAVASTTSSLRPATATAAATDAITGLDLAVLALLAHVWLLVVGLAVWNDDAQTGLDWLDRRVDLDPRLYAVAMGVATLLTWLPFALGRYPVGPGNPFGRSRTALGVIVAGGLLVGTGCYLLAGAGTNVRSYLAVRRSRPVEADGVEAESGPVRVEGEVTPIEGTLEAPVSGTEAVQYRLDATRVVEDERLPMESPTGDADQGTKTGFADLGSLLVDHTERVDERRVPFAVRDETGRIAVDPEGATVRLERSASVPVPADATPPEPLATRLLGTDADPEADDAAIYHESVLEPGDEVTVVGVARDGATITDAPSMPEFVVAPGRDRAVDRHFRRTIAGCAFGATVTGVIGLWLLFGLAGHGWWLF
ncbi:E3 Ubiquitin ligase [Halobiforma haloterrestris]|uniref:RING-type E3 ubiquitin transferase n=1 Tax=Natronobacterium haloterrestre TaxID=148448 RepID=A0A1I1JH56_NATHA|nr:E3 ubiquitin ligase family protein [Halobiforma haloterrestris]SFC47874.1 E3 Ubiquitin ligase [Halobiforma haloterrestris]